MQATVPTIAIKVMMFIVSVIAMNTIVMRMNETIMTVMSIFYLTAFIVRISGLSDFHATVVVRMFNCCVMLMITRFD